MNVVALILARGGSKSIPRKNLRLLNGHPLVAYSIAAAQAASQVERVIVSTEDKEIRQVALAYGAEVPFLRPDAYAQDLSRDIEGIQHALDWLALQEGYEPQVVVHLRPTAPLYPQDLVDVAVTRLLNNPKAHSVRSLTRTPRTPYKMWVTCGDTVQPVVQHPHILESYNAPRQVLPQAYDHTGHVDVFWAELVRTRHTLTGTCVYPVFVEPAFCVDIDTLEDFQTCTRRIQTIAQTIVLPERC